MAKTADEGAGGKGTSGEDSATFECNICLDTARDAVISFCGHLFCWPCLHQWLETRPQRPVCPVCKAGISRDKVIPVYGRGGSKEDPRDKMPPRPPGQRTEPEPTPRGGAHHFGFGDTANFQMSFGIGGFPFGLFASTFNFGLPVSNDRPSAAAPDLNSSETLMMGGANVPGLLLLLLVTLGPGTVLAYVMLLFVLRSLDLQDQLVSKMFIWLACIFLLWLIIA